MKLAVMQPYFMPYIGYWQVMNMVDQYVIYDDVNFIKSGWINRNRILVNGEAKYINIPLMGMSPNKLINEISISTEKVLWDKMIRKIGFSYKRAPYYENVMPMLEKVITFETDNLSIFLENSLKTVCNYMDINTILIRSSQIAKNSGLKGEARLLDICKKLGATEYYNAAGGKSLYSTEHFMQNGISLFFLEPQMIQYKQFENSFVPWLSIIDVLMFNDLNVVKEMLSRYNIC